MKPQNLREMYESEDYQMYESETLQNVQYHCINDTYVDNVQQFINLREDGHSGYTHCAQITCWREYMSTSGIFDICDDEALIDAINAEIDAVEKWHENNGSLFDMI